MLAKHDDAVLVDVRTRAEWAYVGVPDIAELGRDAQFVEWLSFPANEPNRDFVEQVRETGLIEGDKRPVLFLCRSGVRSIGAATAATAAGLGPAYNVLDGFEGGLDGDAHRGRSGWRASGLAWKQS